MFAIDDHRLHIIGGRDAASVNFYNTSVIYNFNYNMWQTMDTYPLPYAMAGFAAAIYSANNATACTWAIDSYTPICPVDAKNRSVIYINGGSDSLNIYSNLTIYPIGKTESPLNGYDISCKLKKSGRRFPKYINHSSPVELT